MCNPDNWAENQRVEYYCNKYEWDSPCEPFTPEKIAKFAKGFKDCLQKVGGRGGWPLMPGPARACACGAPAGGG